MIGTVSAAIRTGAPTAIRVSHDDRENRATPLRARLKIAIGSPCISDASPRPRPASGAPPTPDLDCTPGLRTKARQRSRSVAGGIAQGVEKDSTREDRAATAPLEGAR